VRRLSDMVCNKSPLFLPQTASVRQACQLMKQHKAGSVLVVDDKDRLVGIFTGRDAVRRVLAAEQNGEVHLGQVMTETPTTISPEKTAIDALRLMGDGGFRHLPLVHNERVVGVISRGDFENDELLQLDEERQLWEHMR
jgi:CBS domain-containing protein